MQDAIIIDIDHTVADGGFRAHDIKEWYEKVGDLNSIKFFEPLQPVVDLIDCFLGHSDNFLSVLPIFVTARPESLMEHTQFWIDNNFKNLKNYILLMRPNDDEGEDWRAKLNLAQKHIIGKYNILCVFEDKGEVIQKCWRPLGFRVLQVYT